jgi:hypothetical protein
MLYWRYASVVQPVFKVSDRDRNTTIVALYLDEPSLYNPKNCEVWSTIYVMYEFQKTFTDMSRGIQVENGRCIQNNPRV